jgi:hypothetical protein
VDRDGAVIIEGLMSSALADQIHQETMPFIDATPGDEAYFCGKHTTRIGALAVRSAGCRELITHPVILNSAKASLAAYCVETQLHLTQVIRIKSGQLKQSLNRDRVSWGELIPASIEPQLKV